MNRIKSQAKSVIRAFDIIVYSIRVKLFCVHSNI